MDNNQLEERKGNIYRKPYIDLHTYCREVKGREIIRERDQERNIRSMQTGGDISTRGVIIFPMMSKGEKEKYQKRKSQAHEVKERIIQRRYTFRESLFFIDIKREKELGKKHGGNKTCEEKE
jgi:hypothetical protein